MDTSDDNEDNRTSIMHKTNGFEWKCNVGHVRSMQQHKNQSVYTNDSEVNIDDVYT